MHIFLQGNDPFIPELLRKAVKGIQNWPFFKKLEKSAKFLKGELNPGLLCGSQVQYPQLTRSLDDKLFTFNLEIDTALCSLAADMAPETPEKSK